MLIVTTIQELTFTDTVVNTKNKFTTNAARVTSIQADCDELDIILEQFPFLDNDRSAQNFTGNVAKMIMVFWQQKYN